MCTSEGKTEMRHFCIEVASELIGFAQEAETLLTEFVEVLKSEAEVVG